MTYRHVSFPIQLGRPTDPMIFAARAAVADVLRGEARTAVARAGEAGIDALTLGQRLVMHYMAACGQSLFLRKFPQAAARWCFMVEQNGAQLATEGYPAAPAMSVGSYGYGWLTLMPHNVVLINAGGVKASGLLDPDGLPIVLHEVREVRLTRGTDLDGMATYTCTVIMSDASGERDQDPVSDEPLPVEQEDL